MTQTFQCPTPIDASILDAGAFDRLHYTAANLSAQASRIEGIGSTERATPDQLVELLMQAQLAAERANDALHLAVEAARDHGMSWAQIGDAFGISRQSAHERFA